MSENFWINEGDNGQTRPQDDMSSFLNYLDADDNNNNNNNSNNNFNTFNPSSNRGNTNNNGTISFEAALNSTDLFSGSKPTQPQANNLQQQFMQQRQQQMHNQPPQQQQPQQQQFNSNSQFVSNQIAQFQQQQMRNQQKQMTDNSELIQNLLREKSNGNNMNPNQPQQSPQMQQQGFAPNVFSPPMNQKQVGTPQQQPQPQPQQPQQPQPNINISQLNPNVPMDRAAMLSILQQNANTPQQRFEQQLIQQKLIQHQQQQQQQQQSNISSGIGTPQGDNMNPQQQAIMQMQQQQSMRLQQMQQQQQRQQSQQGSVPPTPQTNNGMNSPLIGNQFNNQQQQQMRGPSQPSSQTPNLPQQGNQPQGSQPSSGSQSSATDQNRKIQQQISAAHIELFMRALSDFMKSKGLNLSIPFIGEKRIHPFYFYAVVTRLGGSMKVNAMNHWNVVAQKLNLPIDMNPNIAGELAKAYAELLLPFEQYTSTPEGQQDLASRRMALQKQQEQLLRQQSQVPPQPTGVAQAPQQFQRNPPISQGSPSLNQSQPPTPFNPGSRLSQSSITAGSPLVSQQQVPPQNLNSRKPSNNNSPMVDINASAKINTPSPANNNLNYQAQAQSQFHQAQVQAQAQAQNQAQTAAQSKFQPQQQPQQQQKRFQEPPLKKTRTTSIPNTVPDANLPNAAFQQDVKLGANIIRNYIPDQRLVIDHHLGYDVKALSAQGQVLDESKPIFLFAPELGAINIHALTMSFESGITSEVTTALNTALVTSADSNLQIPLMECGDFLEKLASLGLKTLNSLVNDGEAAVVNEEEFDLDNLNTGANNERIDDIFNKYVKNAEEYEEVELKVDSFSGAVVSQDEVSDDAINSVSTESVKANGSVTETASSSSSASDITQYHITSYLTMLQNIKHEAEDTFSKIHTRTAEDPKVQLVEQLTTISMILRNITFTENNSQALVSNSTFVDFIFKLIHSIATQPDKFIFTRRKLGLLKDCLMIFLNIAEGLYLRNHNDALAVIALVLTFGSEEDSTNGSIIPEYIPAMHKYQPHSVDVLAKLLVRDPPNRTLLRAVITGVYDTPDLEMEEHQEMRKLFFAGLGDQFDLLDRLFKYLISVIPLNKINPIVLIQERDALVIQSLIALILLVDFIPLEQMQFNIALRWLSLSESIGSGLMKLGLSLTALSVNHKNNPVLYEIYSLISSRIFQLLNILTSKTLEYMEFHPEEGKSQLSDIRMSIPSDSMLGVMLTDLNLEILNEILIVNENIKKINSLILDNVSISVSVSEEDMMKE
ncbi:hypothetical protein WICPIJ_009530 [Wickerhamomyces pijperi]|uniref:ARID domain-containing protein n=1 Tax=Wickerhamomyces pijperi TaxID=599730 RepID=A0A9P8PMF4_WICPI|nr:hypothetical protein WICPIJ_009530 [Wickerhamomyces pijperi]